MTDVELFARYGSAWRTVKTRGRFAVMATVHDWAWTYSNITAADAQEIAGRLTTHSGELWTVEPIAS